MKKTLIALSMFAVFGAANADTMFRASNDGGGTINLTDNTSPSCDRMRSGYKVVYSVLPNANTEPLRGCWKMIDDNFHVLWEGGGERMFPIDRFDITDYAEKRYLNRKTTNAL